MSNIDARFVLRRGDFALDATFRAPAHGVTALVGPSGCGKSTLLHCIAGLEPAVRGTLRVGDELWQDSESNVFVPAHRRRVGYVFQDAGLLTHLNVRGNLEYGMKRRGRARSGPLFARTVEWVGIGPLLERRIQGLSGGERSRVAIASALLRDPVMLLMDEPLAALDARSKAEMLPYLERLHGELSIPMLYVSHAIDEVARLADHLVSLEPGRVVACGTLHEMLTRLDLPLAHSDEAAAILDAVVSGFDAQYQLVLLDFPGGRLAIPQQQLPEGTAVRVRVLARDVSLSLEHHRNTSILNIFPVRVLEMTEDRPAQAIIRLDAAGTVLLARVTRRSMHSLGLVPGTAIYAQVKSVALLR
ncbi:MAG: molybdenum ABC transporter ATP-binding protein [Gammaproteobacteria bacterium]|nr:molybdenum ABC transporter ATP-binding protein [Gammaproteobacteria bacterium]